MKHYLACVFAVTSVNTVAVADELQGINTAHEKVNGQNGVWFETHYPKPFAKKKQSNSEEESDDTCYYTPPQKVRDSMPLGTCFSQESGESYVDVENCVYAALNPCCLRGVFLPEAPPLFLPFKADPRQLEASVGGRFHDDLFGSFVADVSYFDTIPVYRWFNLLCPCDQLEVDIEGALWALFQPFKESAPLVNADYYIGFSLNYALDCWSFRLRTYHISSHIGDEFLLEHPNFDRVNPSAEYVDLFASLNLSEDLRLYLGGGIIAHSDPSFKMSHFFAQGGAEVYLPWFRFLNLCHMIEGRPYFAMNFNLWQKNDWDIDQTYVLGYEIGKLYGLERKLRAYLEYHDGYSVEGQFCNQKTTYFSLRLSYGF